MNKWFLESNAQTRRNMLPKNEEIKIINKSGGDQSDVIPNYQRPSPGKP